MISHKKLNDQELKLLLKTIDKDKNLLFYSYLTHRKEYAHFFGQFNDNYITSVLANYPGLSFKAFSFYSIKKEKIFLKDLVEFARESTQISKNETCSTILSSEDFQMFQSLNIVKESPQKFIYMKHIDSDKLIESDLPIEIEEKDFTQVRQFMKESNMNYFEESELVKCPFIGIKEYDTFFSIGGFHFYDSQLVEIGNIVTREDQRGRGLGKIISSKLTQIGKKLSDDVYLGVLAENTPAIRVYEGIGYQPIVELNLTDFYLDV